MRGEALQSREKLHSVGKKNKAGWMNNDTSSDVGPTGAAINTINHMVFLSSRLPDDQA